MNQYLFLLGRNSKLSRAELLNFCDEVWYDEAQSLFIADHLQFENPRGLPKTADQLFLDRLGGTIRMGKILGEFFSIQALHNSILQHIKDENLFTEKIKMGASAFGCGKHFLKEFMPKIKNSLEQELGLKVRLCNTPGQNLSSGRIFDERLLQKGYEFIIVQQGHSFLLTKTTANQNIRNYTLRDRIKSFRDAKLGMLPPKLAQILINLAHPGFEEVVIDPFCGTGTVNIEAAIMGYHTIGADRDASVISGATDNFVQLAEKFRYPESWGTFFTSEAQQFPKEKLSGVMVTEGFLGFNFEKKPSSAEIEKNIKKILSIWADVLSHLESSPIRLLCFCLPAWRDRGGWVSISEKLFAKTHKSAYTPLALFENQKTYLYHRPEAFVAREICVVVRSHTQSK